MLRMLFLFIVFAVVNIHAEDNPVSTKEIDIQKMKSDDDSTNQETPEKLTAKNSANS